ncbi:hypothetical protein QQM79_21065, partial [Marinobacteraceae bacterium S3BR75-40.1]
PARYASVNPKTNHQGDRWMKQKKAVHVKNEKVTVDKGTEDKKVTQEELVKSARKTEQRTMLRSKNSSVITFVEME